jgi:hypothetical protein
MNELVFSAVDPEDAERVIDEVVAACRAEGRPVEWCVGPWTRLEDFGDRLARRGFTSWGVRGMGRDTGALAGPPPRGTEVAEVLRARGCGCAVTQAREATSAPILERLGFETLFTSRCYVLET